MMNSKSFENLKTELEKLLESKQGSLELQENREYPNEDRLAQLEAQIEAIEGILENIENYIDT
jgi:hypothetical protein